MTVPLINIYSFTIAYTSYYHGAMSKNAWYYFVSALIYPSFISSQLISWYLISSKMYRLYVCDAFVIVMFCISYSKSPELHISCSSRVRTPHFQLRIPVLTSFSQLQVAISVVPQVSNSPQAFSNLAHSGFVSKAESMPL